MAVGFVNSVGTNRAAINGTQGAALPADLAEFRPTGFGCLNSRPINKTQINGVGVFAVSVTESASASDTSDAIFTIPASAT